MGPLKNIWGRLVAHALLRAATALLPSQGIREKAGRSHDCERGTQECVRHGNSNGNSNSYRYSYV